MIWYHNIWYHIIWHHMLWYHIIWCYMTRYDKLRYTCWTCSGHVPKKVWRVKNEVFPKSFGDLWAMFWHHPWCLRAGQKIKKVGQTSEKKCFSDAPESHLNSFEPKMKSRALFSHWFMHFFIFPIFHFFPIFPLFISDIFNPEGCRSAHRNTIEHTWAGLGLNAICRDFSSVL